jgi:hypothetical protein
MKKSGLTDINGEPLSAGDHIRFTYPDECEPEGFGEVIARVVFENGAFVAKEIHFEHYNWNTSNRPELLYDFLRDNLCTKTTLNLEL